MLLGQLAEAVQRIDSQEGKIAGIEATQNSTLSLIVSAELRSSEAKPFLDPMLLLLPTTVSVFIKNFYIT